MSVSYLRNGITNKSTSFQYITVMKGTPINPYVPNYLVTMAHKIPHLTQQLSSSLEPFPIDGFSLAGSTSYLTSIAIFPAIIIVAGVLSVIIFQLVLVSRFCCQKCCKCCDDRKKREHEDPNCCFCWNISKNNPITIAFFYIFLVLAICANNLMFLGNNSMTTSIHDMGAALGSLANIFDNIAGLSSNLQASGKGILVSLNSTSCISFKNSTGSGLQHAMTTFVSSSGSMGSFVGGLPQTLRTNRDLIVSVGGPMKDQVVFIYYGIIFFVGLMFAVSTCCRSKAFLNIWVVLAELIVLTLTIMAGIEMVVVVSFEMKRF